jgi:hypothetical protein
VTVPVEKAVTGQTYRLTLKDRVINGKLTGPMYRGRVIGLDSKEVTVQIECMGSARNTVVLAVEKWPREQTEVEELV